MQAKTKLDIVIWAFPSWSGDYLKSTVELAKELSLHHRVLYIDYSYTWKDLLSRRGSDSIPRSHIMGKDNGLRNITLVNGGKIYVLSLPPVLPVNWISNSYIYTSIERLNSTIVIPRVRRALLSLNFKTNIAVNAFNPFMSEAMTSVFDKCPLIYYCYDNISASHWASKHGKRLERDFAVKAAAVIYTSEALRENKKLGVAEYVVNNGVDLRNFNRVESTDRSKGKKCVGYVGSVDDRLDYDMLEQVVVGNPNWDFQFIGRCTNGDWGRLMAYSNVTFTGAVNPSLLPDMMAAFDLGIIPFVKSEFTRNIYPMKVNEYLALGLPVVSSSFADIADLAQYMSFADSAGDFSKLLKEEMQNDSPEKKLNRKLKAARNSWENKALEFENIMMQYVANQ